MIILKSGRIISSYVVVFVIGICFNIELVKNVGIDCSWGIIVNDYL